MQRKGVGEFTRRGVKTSDHRKFAVVESAFGNVKAHQSINRASIEGTQTKDDRESAVIESVPEIEPRKINNGTIGQTMNYHYHRNWR